MRTRLGRLLYERDARGHPTETVLSVYRDLGVIVKDSRSDNFNKTPEDLSGYKLVVPGDVVINKMKAWQGSIGMSDHRGIVSGDYLVCGVRGKVDRRFLHHLLRSPQLIAEYGARSDGIRPSQWRLYWDGLRDISVDIPGAGDQRAIADHLDRETARIDSLIGAKQRMLGLLEERRAAMIAQAVTPATGAPNWRLLRLRHVLRRMIDTEHKTAPFYDGGEFLVVRTNNISRGRLVVGAGSKFTDSAGYHEWTRRGVPQSGDILLTREAPAGEACLVPNGLQACIGQRTVMLKVDESRILARYCLWALYGGIARSFIDELSQGSTVSHLNMADISDIPLWVPNIAEQQCLADGLDRSARRIDATTAIVQRQIGLLTERRQALISAVVTGNLPIPVAA
jgi:type I restriction enzyme S subunit